MGGIEGSRVANSHLAVVLLKRNATVMSMGTARTKIGQDLQDFCIWIPLLCRMNEAVIFLFLPLAQESAH